MEQILEQIKAYADQAHGDQRRKYTPERYIAHPVRVMEICRQYHPTLPVLAAALLHDVLEDTPVKPGALQEFLLSVMGPADANKTLKLITELTDIYTKEAWPRLNRRLRKAKEGERLAKVSACAQTIKYADIMDNSLAISGQDMDFAPVYLKEAVQLLNRMEHGSPELRARARELVENELAVLGAR